MLRPAFRDVFSTRGAVPEKVPTFTRERGPAQPTGAAHAAGSPAIRTETGPQIKVQKMGTLSYTKLSQGPKSGSAMRPAIEAQKGVPPNPFSCNSFLFRVRRGADQIRRLRAGAAPEIRPGRRPRVGPTGPPHYQSTPLVATAGAKKRA